MKIKNNTIKLVLLLICLIFLYSLSKNGDIFFPTFFIISSIILMVKSSSMKKKDIIIAVILGVVSLNPIYGFCSIFGYIGAKSFFNSTKHKIEVLPKSLKEIFIFGFIGTTILSSINTIWMLTDVPINFSLNGNAVIMGLIAGIPEEILFKYLLFAICVYIVGDKKFTKMQTVLCYLIMIIPHVLKHYPSFSAIGFGSFLLMCFFGFSFTYIQKKSCLTVAIGVHFMVDYLRFIIFGV